MEKPKTVKRGPKGLVSARELERETDAALLRKYNESLLHTSLLTALRSSGGSLFVGAFERAARLGVEAPPDEALAWLIRYAGEGRGVPDAIPLWDVASRQWLVSLARRAPDLVQASRAQLPACHQSLVEFCLAITQPSPLPAELSDALAKHYLNAGPDGYAYAELIDDDLMALCAERLLSRQSYPVLRRSRAEVLARRGTPALTLGLATNYCAQDFRSFGVGLLQACRALDAETIARRAEVECSPEGKIVLALQYVRLVGKRSAIPHWAEKALLLDLCSGSLDDVQESLDSLLAMDATVARRMLSEALREERAMLMVPALADEQLLHTFLARIEEGKVERTTAVEALSRCGREGVAVLLSLQNSSRPSGVLAQVVAEALGSLLKPDAVGDEAAALDCVRAAEMLVPWLGHSSKAVVVAARRTLERLGACSQDALHAGLSHSRKAVRVQSARMLDWLQLQRPAQVTPLDLLCDSANANAEFRTAFLAVCERVFQNNETIWSTEVRPAVRKHGALCLEWLRPWFERHVPHGDVRLWCYVVELLADDPVAAWVAVDTFARMPKLPTSLWARPRRALAKMGSRITEPAAFVLTHGSTEYREPLYGLLAQRTSSASISVLLAGLSDESKPIRGHAVDGLSRVAEVPLQAVLLLLDSDAAGVRVAAAELLAVWGREPAAAALVRAYRKETRGQVRAYLEEALAAVGSGSEIYGQRSEQSVAAFLAARGAKLAVPRFLLSSPPPELHFRSGAALSSAEAMGFLSLVAQLDSTLKGRLVRDVAELLDPKSLAKWSRHIHERWLRSRDSRLKWAVYQLWLLADESLVAEVASSLGDFRANEHVAVSCYLRVLQWHAGRVALDWLVHWGDALPSRGLRALARTLLGRVAYRRSVSVGELLDRADRWVGNRYYETEVTSLASLDRRALERFSGYLEGCLMSERTWEISEWALLYDHFEEMMASLVWCVQLAGADGVLGGIDLCVVEGSRFRSPLGDPIDRHDVRAIAVAHPLRGSPSEWESCAQWLSQSAKPPPFEQVHRPLFIQSSEQDLALSELDTDSVRLDKWLRRQRWFHGEPLDHGIVYSNTKRVGSAGVVFQLTHTGYPIGRHDFAEDVQVQRLEAFDTLGNELDFQALSPQLYSELCWSVSQITRPVDES